MSKIPDTRLELIPIMKELIKREPIFHRLEFGTSRAALETMTHDEFWEVGASGNQYSREDIINTLLERYKKSLEDTWEAQDFRCFEICPSTYLLTYMLIQDTDRITRRSTLWQYKNKKWKILYHQGTIVQDAR